MQPSLPTAGSDTAPRVRAELLRLGYTDLPAGLLATLLVGAGLAWVMSRAHASVHPWLWLLGLGILTTLRLFNVAWYRRVNTIGSVIRWERWFVLGALLTAAGWGYAGWAFFPIMDQTERSLLILVLAGITAGATRSLGPVLAACWSFQLLTLLPLVLRFFTGAEVVLTVMGVLATLYLVFLMAMARSFRRSLSDSLRLGFDYAVLVGELQEKKLQADAFNRGLTDEIKRRRQIEAELRTAKESAEAASLAKSDFLAMMSHEIRTPMNGVLGMLDLLKSTALNAAQREQVDTAANSADSLLRILNDILDFSKIETGRLEFEHIPFVPAVLAEEVAGLLRPSATAKSLALAVVSDPAAGTKVLGDPTRLRQVLLNLVGNAIKFSERGEIKLGLTTTLPAPTLLRLTVAVSDTGIGMSAATQSGLFQPFMQADSSMSRRYGGSGLGLAISQRLMHYMGGKITVKSQPGQGSVFSLALDLPLAADQAAPAPLTLGASAQLHFHGRILVVEDDPVNQRVIKLMLERAGLDCHVVEDGLTALDVLKQGDWDLVFMDCQLPGIDGFETTRRARAWLAGRPVPIVALTANARAEDRAACLAAGMDEFVTKPIRSDALRNCLARWLTPAT
jgi:signal transduction histidine kinase